MNMCVYRETGHRIVAVGVVYRMYEVTEVVLMASAAGSFECAGRAMYKYGECNGAGEPPKIGLRQTEAWPRRSGGIAQFQK